MKLETHMKPEIHKAIDKVFSDADADFKRKCDELKPRRTYIFGMVPWMFWVFVLVVIFALVGPELITVFRK